MRYSHDQQPDVLFSKYDSHAILNNQDNAINHEVDNFGSDRMLKTSPEDLSEYISGKFTIDVPVLHENEIVADQKEIEIDVRHDQNRYISDRSQPACIKGTEISLTIPYDGDEQLLFCRPSTFSYSPPQAFVEKNQIILVTKIPFDKTNDNIRSGFDSTIGQIKSNLDILRTDFTPFNESLKEKAKTLINSRRDKLLKDQGLVSSLGFPLKKRDDVPKTYVIDVQKKIEPVLPPMSEDPFAPEPELSMQKYEEILNMIKSMVLVIERSPKRFRDLDEESIRDQFLFQLNAQYKGQATGETFNYKGKTDILIRENNKNIFIAECKFWKGKEVCTQTIDQILGYTSWRDTKTAILIFNKNKNFTEAIGKAKEALLSHPNFKRELEYTSETGFRVVVSNIDDEARELILAIELFNIPGK